jgi:hypothetical protein
MRLHGIETAALTAATAIALCACATGGSPGALHDAMVLRPDDPILDRVTFATATYLKSAGMRDGAAFTGVYVNGELQERLTRDVRLKFGFPGTPMLVSLAPICRDATSPTARPPAVSTTPSDPADPRRTPVPAPQQPPGVDERGNPQQICTKAESRYGPQYSLNRLAIAGDTVYVHTFGLRGSSGCLLVARSADTVWTVVKERKAQGCGK